MLYDRDVLQSEIARFADKYVGSDKWAKNSTHGPGIGKNKCNLFIADMVEEAGGSVPKR